MEILNHILVLFKVLIFDEDKVKTMEKLLQHKTFRRLVYWAFGISSLYAVSTFIQSIRWW